MQFANTHEITPMLLLLQLKKTLKSSSHSRCTQPKRILTPINGTFDMKCFYPLKNRFICACGLMVTFLSEWSFEILFIEYPPISINVYQYIRFYEWKNVMLYNDMTTDQSTSDVLSDKTIDIPCLRLWYTIGHDYTKTSAKTNRGNFPSLHIYTNQHTICSWASTYTTGHCRGDSRRRLNFELCTFSSRVLPESGTSHQIDSGVSGDNMSCTFSPDKESLRYTGTQGATRSLWTFLNYYYEWLMIVE